MTKPSVLSEQNGEQISRDDRIVEQGAQNTARPALEDNIDHKAPHATGWMETDPITGKDCYTGSRISDTNRALFERDDAIHDRIVGEIGRYGNPSAWLGTDPEFFRAQYQGSMDIVNNTKFAGSAFDIAENVVGEGYTTQGGPYDHQQRELNSGPSSEEYLAKNLSTKPPGYEKDLKSALSKVNNGLEDQLSEVERTAYEYYIVKEQAVHIFDALERGEELTAEQQQILNKVLNDQYPQFKAEQRLMQLKTSVIAHDLAYALSEQRTKEELVAFAENSGIDSRKLLTISGMFTEMGRHREIEELQALIVSQRLNGCSQAECKVIERLYNAENEGELQAEINQLDVDNELLNGFEARAESIRTKLEEIQLQLENSKNMARCAGLVTGAGSLAWSALHRRGQIKKANRLLADDRKGFREKFKHWLEGDSILKNKPASIDKLIDNPKIYDRYVTKLQRKHNAALNSPIPQSPQDIAIRDKTIADSRKKFKEAQYFQDRLRKHEEEEKQYDKQRRGDWHPTVPEAMNAGVTAVGVAAITNAATFELSRRANEGAIRRMEQALLGLSQEQVAIVLGHNQETTIAERVRDGLEVDILREGALGADRPETLNVTDAELDVRARSVVEALNERKPEHMGQEYIMLPYEERQALTKKVARVLNENFNALSDTERATLISKIETQQKASYTDPNGDPIKIGYPLTFDELLTYSTGTEGQALKALSSSYKVGFDAEKKAEDMLASLQSYNGYIGAEAATDQERAFAAGIVAYQLEGLSKDQVRAVFEFYEDKLNIKEGGLFDRLEEVIGVEHGKLKKLEQGTRVYEWDIPENEYQLKRDAFQMNMEQLYRRYAPETKFEYRGEDIFTKTDRALWEPKTRGALLTSISSLSSDALPVYLKLYAAKNGTGGLNFLASRLGESDYDRLVKGYNLSFNPWSESKKVAEAYNAGKKGMKAERGADAIVVIQAQHGLEGNYNKSMLFRDVARRTYGEKIMTAFRAADERN